MDRFAALQAFVSIVDSGSFTHAAARLGMSPAMMSTHITRLEERLGTKLLDRTTRRIALTQNGRRFLEDARAILAAMEAAEGAVRRGGEGPSGHVQIDAPGAVGLRFIVPALPAFRSAHPGVTLDLSVGDRGAVFRPDGFDVLVRVGDPGDSRNIATPLGTTRFVQVASPDYLARCGAPESPDAMHEHDSILYGTVETPGGHRWRFWRDGEIRRLRPRGVVTFNHGDAITAAAVAGVAIAQTLEMLVAAELADGRLVRLLDDWNRDAIPILQLVQPDRATRPAVEAVTAFLRDQVVWPHYQPRG